MWLFSAQANLVENFKSLDVREKQGEHEKDNLDSFGDRINGRVNNCGFSGAAAHSL
jgi:hypothetical protein